MRILFIYLNHPLALGRILLTQTILIRISTRLLYYNFWFRYIIFLVIIRGLLIIFIYITRTASNEKFKIPKIRHLIIILIRIGILPIILIINPPYLISIIKFDFYSSIINNVTLNKFYNLPFIFTTLILIIYLLLTLFVVVKITSTNNGPLRQK